MYLSVSMGRQLPKIGKQKPKTGKYLENQTYGVATRKQSRLGTRWLRKMFAESEESF